MKVELSDTDGPMFLEFELHGQLSRETISAMIHRFDEGTNIQKIAIEIAVENPDSVTLPTLKESDPSSENRPNAESVNEDNAATQIQTHLQPGGTPFNIMRFLSAQDDWLLTVDIVEAIPDEWDVAKQTLNSTLWNLRERELVEKRTYEQDNRQNEYHISPLGELALENAIDGTDDLVPIE